MSTDLVDMPRHNAKNSSAWLRMNKFLSEHDDYLGAVNGNTAVTTAFAALMGVIDAIATTAGLPTAATPTVPMPCAQNVWLGKLAYDTFVLDEGSGRYKAVHRDDFRAKAFTFRKAVYAAKDAFRMREDLYNTEEDHTLNPGGRADGEGPEG